MLINRFAIAMLYRECPAVLFLPDGPGDQHKSTLEKCNTVLFQDRMQLKQHTGAIEQMIVGCIGMWFLEE